MKILRRIKQRIIERMNKNACVKCWFYCKANGTCQIKKCAGMGYGYVSLRDWLYCEPREAENE